MTTKKQVPWLAIVAVVVGVIVFGLLLWKGPWWFDGAHLRTKDLQPADGVVITGFRTALVAVGVALTAAVGLFYTHRNHQATLDQLEHTRAKDREQAELTRESQYADLYVDAINLLATKDSPEGPGLTERLGGIYALERVMRDSAKDQGMVVQILAAFVRQRAPREDPDDEAISSQIRGVLRPSDDVQAALTVLGRRPHRDQNEGLIDLSFTELSRVDLMLGRFNYASFKGANLYQAVLAGTKLSKADLGAADLRGAQLSFADLRGAKLIVDDVSGCPVEAKVSAVQLLDSTIDATTVLPRVVAEDPLIREMLQEKPE
ncbi:pentapeptide repeat-containing protein [Streptomyces microflavus]|uniref:pentapeptide repeat-containing protein n=1 Tax=Streptomyces microflavus TaxID=1919 RepID=UPI002255923C|nr:pentapeptide repeat-containing protein [Streptomyces microflavus]MCX4657412.1 pentapeptide repeat-containing protein [Streptomyces microflavus]